MPRMHRTHDGTAPTPDAGARSQERVPARDRRKPVSIYDDRGPEIDQAVNNLLALKGVMFDGYDMLDAFIAGAQWAIFNVET
jgi:hypothetical protein